MLSSLPESLDETYERMLCNINYYLIEDARRILTLLCFAQRPLTVPELIEGVAVEIHNSVGLNPKRRLQDSNGIRDICGSFISIGLDTDHTTKNRHEKESIPTVRIAHFSVQEYLESERIRHQKAAMFSLTSATAHAEIAQICLIYLLEPGLSRSKLQASILEEYPLALFAAKYWYYHHQKLAEPAPGVEDCILRLFQRRDSFVTWIRLDDVDLPIANLQFNRPLSNIPTSVYYASLLGLDPTLHELLNSEELESATTSALLLASTSKISKRINAPGGRYGNALQAASFSGHDIVVQMLLDRGADLNLQGGQYDYALQAALFKGHDKVVQLLLNRGANINAQDERSVSALQVASQRGHKQIVKMLLDKGAEINAQGGRFGSALQVASQRGYKQIVKMLLDTGAEINAQDGRFGSALQAASYEGHEQIVKMLLDKGAEINAQGGRFGSALQVASQRGYKQIVKMLLDTGANINAQDGYYGNALQAALFSGHEQIINMLLDKGVDINARGGPFGNALQAASFSGHDKVWQLLIDNGASVNAEELGIALQEASCQGHDKMVQLLIDNGAKINAEKLDHTLQSAERRGYDKVVQLLRNHEAALRREPSATDGCEDA